jgi:hypothetical protein
VLPRSIRAVFLTVCCQARGLPFCVFKCLVQTGCDPPSAPIRDAFRNELCIRCRRKLSAAKGKKLQIGAAHLCQVCINEIWNPAEKRAEKRETTVTVGGKSVTVGESSHIITRTTTAVAAATAAPPSPPALQNTATVISHGWQYIPPPDLTHSVVQRGWQALIANGQIVEWAEKRGVAL